MQKKFLTPQIFTKWKNPNKNEDSYAFSDNTLVVSDWATDKSWKIYEWKTWWEIISKLISEEVLQLLSNWPKLVDNLNKSVIKMYESYWVDYKNNLENLFSSTLVSARILDEKLIITQLWDTSFRINWEKIYHNNKIIDKINSLLRKKFIEIFWELKVDESRNFIMPILKQQYLYQNSSWFYLNETTFNELFNYIRTNYKNYSENKEMFEKIFLEVMLELSNYKWTSLSYWFIDWRNIPLEHIKTYTFDINKVEKIEIFTDWYYTTPKWTSLEDWENSFAKSELDDPLKYKQFPSTKVSDDRTFLSALIK